MQKVIANRELNKRETRDKKAILDSMPRMLVIVLTNKCNLKCIMCFRVYSGDNFTLPLESVERIYKAFPYLEDIDLQGAGLIDDWCSKACINNAVDPYQLG